jgi:hypothetical protein
VLPFLPACVFLGRPFRAGNLRHGPDRRGPAPARTRAAPGARAANTPPLPPGDRIEGIATLTHLGGENVKLRLSAIGVGADGRLILRDAAGTTVTSSLVAFPPGRPVPPRGTGLDPGAPGDVIAIDVNRNDVNRNQVRTERPSSQEVRVSVPRTGATRSIAIPLSQGGQARDAEKVFVLLCGAAGRMVLAVADGGAATGLDLFEVTFTTARERRPPLRPAPGAVRACGR